MGSFVHPHTFLVLEAIKRTVENVRCSGGVVPAVAEARRLAATYPEAILSEPAILAEFRQQAALYSLPVDAVLPAPKDDAFAGAAGQVRATATPLEEKTANKPPSRGNPIMRLAFRVGLPGDPSSG